MGGDLGWCCGNYFAFNLPRTWLRFRRGCLERFLTTPPIFLVSCGGWCALTKLSEESSLGSTAGFSGALRGGFVTELPGKVFSSSAAQTLIVPVRVLPASGVVRVPGALQRPHTLVDQTDQGHFVVLL